MNYRYQKPHPSLKDYVRTVLVIEGFLDPGQSNFPLVTQGMPAAFYKTGKQTRNLTLFGRSVPAECWQIDSDTTIMAWFFFPFAMASMFNISAKKLVTGPIELSNTIFATELDDFMIGQLDTNRRECEIIRYATDQIMVNSSTEVLSEIQKELNITERTFQRMFKKYVGVTPSQYRRICQFDQSFSQLRSRSFDTLSDVAYDNGFADQSHFIRSFKEFTATTPNAYLKDGLKKS